MEAQVVAAVAEWKPGPGGWLLVWLLKGSLLLALLFPLAALLRRFSSSARHLVWTAGLAVTLALPLASMGVLPWQLELPIVPGLTSSQHASEGVGVSRMTVLQSDAVERADLDETAGSPAARTPESIDISGAPPGPAPAVPDGRSRVPFSWSGVWTGIGWLRLAVLVWAAGAVLLLVQLARSAIHARRLVRHGTPLADPAWRTPLIEAADRLDLPDLPRLLVSPRAAVPLTCGIMRPSIVLPPASETWTDERRRAVLSHELGHIRRRDLVSHLLGRLTCVLYWFQPLAWSAARRMRAESERACDDLVLLTGTRASAYAGHLLEIAAAGRGGAAPAVALPMAQPREFEARLLSILEADKRREPLSRLQAAALAGLVLVMAQPLVALTPSRTSPAQATAPTAEQGDPHEAGPVSHVLNQDSEPSAPSPSDGAVPESPPASAARVAVATRGPASPVLSSARVVAPEDAGPAVPPSKDDPVTAETARAPTVPVVTAAPVDTGRRATRHSFERGIERGAEVIAESVTEITVSTLGRLFESLAGQTAQADPRVRASLIEALSDPAPDVRRTAAWSLSTHADTLVVHALARALRSDEDENVREMSAWALAQLDAPASDDVAVDALSGAVVSGASADVRATAAWALSRAHAATAVSALERAVLADSAATVRTAAAWALATMDASSAIDAISGAMTFDDAEVRETAAWAIGTLEPDRAPESLTTRLQDAAPKVRMATVWALGRIEDPATAAALQETLSDEDADVRAAAIWALSRLPNGAATEALTAALRDPSSDVRAAAAAALGGRGSQPWPWPRPWPRPRPRP